MWTLQTHTAWRCWTWMWAPSRSPCRTTGPQNYPALHLLHLNKHPSLTSCPRQAQPCPSHAAHHLTEGAAYSQRSLPGCHRQIQGHLPAGWWAQPVKGLTWGWRHHLNNSIFSKRLTAWQNTGWLFRQPFHVHRTPDTSFFLNSLTVVSWPDTGEVIQRADPSQKEEDPRPGTMVELAGLYSDALNKSQLN